MYLIQSIAFFLNDIDDVDSSSDSGADSSQSKQDVESNPVSEDSESQASRAVTDNSEAQISNEGVDLTTACDTEPESSEESAGLNEAHAMDSEDISTNVVEHEDTTHQDSITVGGNLLHVESETRMDQTFVQLEKSTGKTYF